MTAVAHQPASRFRSAGPYYVRFRPRYPAALQLLLEINGEPPSPQTKAASETGVEAAR